jgi:hypothetical protein
MGVVIDPDHVVYRRGVVRLETNAYDSLGNTVAVSEVVPFAMQSALQQCPDARQPVESLPQHVLARLMKFPGAKRVTGSNPVAPTKVAAAR